MKTPSMMTCIFTAVAAVLVSFSPAPAKDKFNLAPGARGKLCLECHTTFQAKMKKPYVHTPLKQGECTGCHSPHTSNHGKLMAADADRICQTCHADVVPEKSASSHQVVLEGKCTSCHDPHSADYKQNLVRGGSDLCFGCHEEMGKDIAGNKFPHAPVKQDCLSCHNPHASEKNPSLLAGQVPQLCLDCHDPGKGTFKVQHQGYPVETADCASCHDPHGSDQRSIVYDVVHEPVSKKMCKQCHADPSSPEPFATVKESYELCQGCHYDMVNDAFNKDRIHWPLVDGTGCINCHSPHASSTAKLMKAPMKETCGSCHADTLARQERSQTEHPPIAQGECATCHSVHSSNHPFILKEASTLKLCGECHEWQTHSTHPIGPEVVDPRNPNLTMDCLSCHRTHGTEYKHFIYTETINDLCIQCHTKYRR